MRPNVQTIGDAVAKVAPKVLATSSGSGSTAIIVVGFVLALTGLALTANPPKRGRLTRCIAFVCYLAAAELLLVLVHRLSVLPRVVGGVVAVVLFLLWERLSHRRSVPAASAVPVSDAHRVELQELASAYETTVGYWRRSQGKQKPGHEKSFWDHCPAAGKALEKADAELVKYETATDAFRAWLGRQCGGAPVAGPSILRAVENDAQALPFTVNSGYLWLDGGFGIAAVDADTDVDALKEPHNDLLTKARYSTEGKALRATSLNLRAAQHATQTELERVRMLKAIYGKCDLC